MIPHDSKKILDIKSFHPQKCEHMYLDNILKKHKHTPFKINNNKDILWIAYGFLRRK